jgi:hypothetical protein
MEQQSDPNSNGKVHQTSSGPLEAGMEDGDLRIEIFSLCEGAVEQNGRLFLLGIFENVSAPCFPFVLPEMAVVLRVRFWPAEPQQFSARLVVTNPDGRPVTQIPEGLGANPAAHGEQSRSCNLILHIQNLPIDEPGDYSVDFCLNNRLEARLPFSIRRQTAL